MNFEAIWKIVLNEYIDIYISMGFPPISTGESMTNARQKLWSPFVSPRSGLCSDQAWGEGGPGVPMSPFWPRGSGGESPQGPAGCGSSSRARGSRRVPAVAWTSPQSHARPLPVPGLLPVPLPVPGLVPGLVPVPVPVPRPPLPWTRAAARGLRGPEGSGAPGWGNRPSLGLPVGAGSAEQPRGWAGPSERGPAPCRARGSWAAQSGPGPVRCARPGTGARGRRASPAPHSSGRGIRRGTRPSESHRVRLFLINACVVA